MGKLFCSLFGALIGARYGLVGLLLGVCLGSYLGRFFDEGLRHFSAKQFPELQQHFFTSTFIVMGYIAKLDGVVSTQEINAAEKIMHFLGLDTNKRKAAIELFAQGKKIDLLGIQEHITQLRKVGRWRRDVLQLFLEIQIRMAYDDAKPTTKEQQFLLQIAQQLGFSQYMFSQLEKLYWLRQGFRQGYDDTKSSSHSYEHQRTVPPAPASYSLSQAYRILGVTKKTSEKEIKKAYRKLMSQHHPDKLVSRGLPAEMMKIATEKTQEIKKAYDYIMTQRQGA